MKECSLYVYVCVPKVIIIIFLIIMIVITIIIIIPAIIGFVVRFTLHSHFLWLGGDGEL